MPEETPASASLRQRREEALRGVANRLATLPGPIRQLDPGELRAYRHRSAIHGWRLDVTFTDGVTRRMDLLADRAFPRPPLRVVLVDRPPFLTWPHVEKDRALCLLPETAEVTASDPAAAAANVLGLASTLVEDCLAGRNAEDFRTEFFSYWYWDRTEGCTPVRSLLDPRRSTRLVRVWKGQGFYLLGEDDGAINTRLKHLFDDDRSRTTESALLLWLDRPPVPSEYPRSGDDVTRPRRGDQAPQSNPMPDARRPA